MDPSQQKEQFSLAYVQAVATVAGYALGRPSVDDDSVDATIYATGASATPRRPRLDVQVKCTAGDVLGEDAIRFPLKVKNYNDLRPPGRDLVVPRLLVVVVVPEAVGDWLRQTEEELVMCRCGYWCSLEGFPETDNQESVTVTVPRTQQFTPAALQGIMQRVNDGVAL